MNPEYVFGQGRFPGTCTEIIFFLSEIQGFSTIGNPLLCHFIK